MKREGNESVSSKSLSTVNVFFSPSLSFRSLACVPLPPSARAHAHAHEHTHAHAHQAFEKVRQDKLREVKAGHDGTWVAHPGLLQIAKKVFDEHMPGPNQIFSSSSSSESKSGSVGRVSQKDLLELSEGTITLEGLRANVSVGVRYTEAWLAGNGCVPLFNMMEDAATAEISRCQIWQQLRHKVRTVCGRGKAAREG